MFGSSNVAAYVICISVSAKISTNNIQGPGQTRDAGLPDQNFLRISRWREQNMKLCPSELRALKSHTRWAVLATAGATKGWVTLCYGSRVKELQQRPPDLLKTFTISARPLK